MKALLALLLAAPVYAAEPAPAEAPAPRAAYSPKRLALVRSVTAVDSAPEGGTAYFVTDITGALELWKVQAHDRWPVQLTDLGEQVTSPEVSPDGKTVVFASDFGGDERSDLYLVPSAGGEIVNLTKSTRAEISPTFSKDGKRLAYSSDPDEQFVFQLHVRDLETGAETRLTREKVNVFFPTWSPDGRTIAATRTGDDRSGDLLLAAADGSGVRVIAPPVKGGILRPEAWSPGGEFLLCAAEDAKGFHRLYLLGPESGQGRFIGPEGWDVEDAKWHPHQGIVFTRNEAGASALYRMTDPDADPKLILPAKGRIDDFSIVPNGGMFMVWSDSSHAPDVWEVALPPLVYKGGKYENQLKRRVTESMLGGVEAEALAPGEIIEYPTWDGKKVSAIYLKPPVARLGSPPPVVVMAHGGPDWQSFDDFHPMRQALAEAGFAVLAPNFRGSTGFGRAWLDANRKDWGGGDRKDMIAGVKFLAARGDVDGTRAGITGGSYGGYSTLYALAKNEGDWAAGVAAYGMPDLVLDYELSKSRFATWYETQMGNPKDDAPLFKERSAIHYLDGLKAPLLIFQGANDTNVPLAESELVYKRLKKMKRDVGLVVYPDEGHGFTRRKNLTDYYERTTKFFSEKLAPK